MVFDLAEILRERNSSCVQKIFAPFFSACS
jgi:hypothetical protein